MRRSVLAMVLACSALVAAACGGATTTGQRGGDGGDSPSPSAASPAGDAEIAALDFRVPAVDGSTFRGADYAGDALAIWFWAPW